MRIGVDFDDVLYPYHHFLKERLKRKYGVDLTRDRITTFYYEFHPGLRARGVTREELWKDVQATWLEAEDHADAALLDSDAPRILKDLNVRHQIVIITARTRSALPYMQSFLERHKIEPDEILVGKEDKRGFDVLIDDFPKHAEQNVEAGGHSILYTIDENSTYDESRHPRIFRVHSWKEIADVVRHLEKRRSNIA